MMRPRWILHWCWRRGLLILLIGSISTALLLSISFRLLPYFFLLYHSSGHSVTTGYLSLSQHLMHRQTSNEHIPLLKQQKENLHSDVKDVNKSKVFHLPIVVDNGLHHGRYNKEKHTMESTMEEGKENRIPNTTYGHNTGKETVQLDKKNDGIVKVSRIFHSSHQFIKENTDLFTTDGDESDYLFGACENSAKVKANYLYGFVGPFRYLANYKNPCWMEPGKEDVPLVYCIPYFYLVGAPKAGSSDVFNRITMHPDVVTPEMKETRWFDRARFSGNPHFSSFLHNFYNATGLIQRSLDLGSNFHSRIMGDGSPSYFFDNRQWRRMSGNEGCNEPRVVVASHIHHLYAKARIIFILRNPVHRLYSSYLYNHAKKELVSSRSFDNYVREAIQLYNDCFTHFSLRQCANNATLFQQAKFQLVDVLLNTYTYRDTYVSCSKFSKPRKVMLVVGMYSVFIHDWLQIFPREQLFFMTTEEYTKNMSDHLSKIFSFLHLRALRINEMEEIIRPEVLNRGYHYSTAGPMLNDTKTLLEEFYRPYNEQLASLLGDKNFLWVN